jgi:hypothetical protein
VRVELCLGANAVEALDYLTDTGIARAVLDTIDPSQHDEALTAVAATLAEHERADGVVLAGGINLIRAATA